MGRGCSDLFRFAWSRTPQWSLRTRTVDPPLKNASTNWPPGFLEMAPLSQIVHCDPDILGGTPVFVGTRVPVQSLFDYLEGGDTLDEFLHQFPSVKREQAIAALVSGAGGKYGKD